MIAQRFFNQTEMGKRLAVARVTGKGPGEAIGGLPMPAVLMGNQAQQVPGAGVPRPLGKDGAAGFFRLGQTAGALMGQSNRHGGIIDHRERGYRQWRILG
jgi:hypothetical protein